MRFDVGMPCFFSQQYGYIIMIHFLFDIMHFLLTFIVASAKVENMWHSDCIGFVFGESVPRPSKSTKDRFNVHLRMRRKVTDHEHRINARCNGHIE